MPLSDKQRENIMGRLTAYVKAENAAGRLPTLGQLARRYHIGIGLVEEMLSDIDHMNVNVGFADAMGGYGLYARRDHSVEYLG